MSHRPAPLRFLTATVLAGIALVSGGGIAAAATIRVDDDGTAGPHSCDGSKRVPKRIQGAFERIRNTLGGDTLIICPGTYRGPILIDNEMDSIEIRGTRLGAVRIVRPPGADFDTSGSVFEVTGDVNSALIRNLVITVPAHGRCRSEALVVLGGHDVRFVDNRVIGRADCIQTGIRVRMDPGRSDAKVRRNTIRDVWTAGVEVTGFGALAWVEGNTIRIEMSGSTVPRGISGVVYRDDAAGWAANNVISARSGPAQRGARPTLEHGVLLSDIVREEASVAVSGNRIENAWIGIRLEQVRQNRLTEYDITENTVTGSGRAGIELEITQNASVRQNHVSSATGTGIRMVDASGLTGYNEFISNLIADTPIPCSDPGALNLWSGNDATCLWGPDPG